MSDAISWMTAAVAGVTTDPTTTNPPVDAAPAEDTLVDAAPAPVAEARTERPADRDLSPRDTMTTSPATPPASPEPTPQTPPPVPAPAEVPPPAGFNPFAGGPATGPTPTSVTGPSATPATPATPEPVAAAEFDPFADLGPHGSAPADKVPVAGDADLLALFDTCDPTDTPARAVVSSAPSPAEFDPFADPAPAPVPAAVPAAPVADTPDLVAPAAAAHDLAADPTLDRLVAATGKSADAVVRHALALYALALGVD